MGGSRYRRSRPRRRRLARAAPWSREEAVERSLALADALASGATHAHLAA